MDSNNPKTLAPIPSLCTPYSYYCRPSEVFPNIPDRPELQKRDNSKIRVRERATTIYIRVRECATTIYWTILLDSDKMATNRSKNFLVIMDSRGTLMQTKINAQLKEVKSSHSIIVEYLRGGSLQTVSDMGKSLLNDEILLT